MAKTHCIFGPREIYADRIAQFGMALYLYIIHAFWRWKNMDSISHRIKLNYRILRKYFDFYQLMPSVADDWDKHPLSSHCQSSDVFHGLMGSWFYWGVAHATVPFWTKGWIVVWGLLQYCNNWCKAMDKIGVQYSNNIISRKPTTVMQYRIWVSELYCDARQSNGPTFSVGSEIERRTNYLYPESYFPLCTGMVSLFKMNIKPLWKKEIEQEERIRDIDQNTR